MNSTRGYWISTPGRSPQLGQLLTFLGMARAKSGGSRRSGLGSRFCISVRCYQIANVECWIAPLPRMTVPMNHPFRWVSSLSPRNAGGGWTTFSSGAPAPEQALFTARSFRQIQEHLFLGPFAPRTFGRRQAWRSHWLGDATLQRLACHRHILGINVEADKPTNLALFGGQR